MFNIFKRKSKKVEEPKPEPKFKGKLLQISDPQGDFEWTTRYNPNPEVIHNNRFGYLSLDPVETLRPGLQVGFQGIAPIVTPKQGDILLKHMASGRYMAMEIIQVHSLGDPPDMYSGKLEVIWYADTIKNLDDIPEKILH